MQTWVHDNPGTVSPADAQLALHALDRVSASTSEPYELWVEDAQDPEWTASIAELRQRLERSTGTWLWPAGLNASALQTVPAP